MNLDSKLKEKSKSSIIIEHLVNQECYFKPREFERSGKFYESLGIKYFKRGVTSYVGNVAMPVKRLIKGERPLLKKPTSKNNQFLWSSSLSDLKKFEKMTRLNELYHLSVEPLVGGYLYYSCANDDSVGIVGGLSCLLVNTYCILLQRYNRSRIDNILKKQN